MQANRKEDLIARGRELRAGIHHSKSEIRESLHPEFIKISLLGELRKKIPLRHFSGAGQNQFTPGSLLLSAVPLFVRLAAIANKSRFKRSILSATIATGLAGIFFAQKHRKELQQPGRPED